MKLPDNVKEEDVLKTIDVVAKRLANKFKYGYHGFEDMVQQGTMFALESLDKWDGVRPLENFLQACIHNKLYNDKRDNYERPDKPCLTCPFFDKHCKVATSQCTEYADKENCELYVRWFRRNSTKKNLMQPIDIQEVTMNNERTMRADSKMATEDACAIDQNELWGLIDKHLDISLRADYLKLRSNTKLSKKNREAVEQAILAIAREHYHIEADNE